tara:strand:+ start:409 stop:537 length:129 start_codon:yes stop_codon:yes gene_type:complete
VRELLPELLLWLLDERRGGADETPGDVFGENRSVTYIGKHGV